MKTNTVLWIVIVVLVALITGAGGYLIADNNTKDSDNNNSTSQTEVKDDAKKDNTSDNNLKDEKESPVEINNLVKYTNSLTPNFSFEYDPEFWRLEDNFTSLDFVDSVDGIITNQSIRLVDESNNFLTITIDKPRLLGSVGYLKTIDQYDKVSNFFYRSKERQEGSNYYRFVNPDTGLTRWGDLTLERQNEANQYIINPSGRALTDDTLMFNDPISQYSIETTGFSNPQVIEELQNKVWVKVSYNGNNNVEADKVVKSFTR